MKIKISAISFFLLLFFNFGSLELSADMDSILGSVNGEPITLFDILIETIKLEENLAITHKNKELENEIYKARLKALESIVERKLIFSEFKKESYEIPIQLVEDSIDQMALEVGNGSRKRLRKFVEQNDMTMEDIRRRAYERLAVEIMINEYVLRRVNVTPREVFEYYKENIQKYTEGKKLKISVIYINTEDKNKKELEKILKNIKTELDNNGVGNFKNLAELYSDGKFKKNCDLGWIEVSKLRGEFKDALQNIDKNRNYTDPVKCSEGIYFLAVKGSQNKKTLPFNKLKGQIAEKLKQKQRRRKYKIYIKKLRKNAVIRNNLSKSSEKSNNKKNINNRDD